MSSKNFFHENSIKIFRNLVEKYFYNKKHQIESIKKIKKIELF